MSGVLFSHSHSLPLFVVLSELFLCYSFFLVRFLSLSQLTIINPVLFFFSSLTLHPFLPFFPLSFASLCPSLPGFIDAPTLVKNLSISHVFNPSPHNCVEAPSHFLFYQCFLFNPPCRACSLLSPPFFLTAFIFTLESLSYSRPVSHVPGFWCHLYKQPFSDQRHPHLLTPCPTPVKRCSVGQWSPVGGSKLP